MKKYEPIFYYMSLSNLLFFLGNSFFILLPIYFKNLGATETYIGFISNLDKIFLIATALSLGALIYGRDRIHLLRWGYVILFISYCSYLFISSLSWYIPLIRIMHGIGFSIAMILGTTIIFESVPIRNATEAIGIYGITGAISNAISPAIGEFLLRRGYVHHVLFLISCICILLSLAITFLMPRQTSPDKAGPSPAQGSLLSLFKNINILIYSIVSFIFGGGFGVLITFLPNFIRTETTLNYSYFFIIYIAVLIVIRFIFMSVFESFNKNILVMTVFCIGALMNVFLNWMGNLFWLVIVSIMYGITHGVLYPVLNAHMVSIVHKNDRGRTNALFSAIFNGGMMVFAVISGYTIDYFHSYLAAFNVCAAAFVLAVVLVAIVHLKLNEGVVYPEGDNKNDPSPL